MTSAEHHNHAEHSQKPQAPHGGRGPAKPPSLGTENADENAATLKNALQQQPLILSHFSSYSYPRRERGS